MAGDIRLVVQGDDFGMCHAVNVGTGVPVAAAVNETTVPVQALVLTGLMITIGLLIVKAATAEVVLPQVLENTARY